MFLISLPLIPSPLQGQCNEEPHRNRESRQPQEKGYHMKIPDIKTVMQRSREDYSGKERCGEESEEGGWGFYICSLTDEVDR